MNHVTGEPTGETRNVLVESARIARGDIRDLASVEADDLDGVVLPGGFGAAKNLCDFAVNGVDCSVNPDIAKLIMEMHDAKKPVGFLCIAPALAAKVYSNAGIRGVKLTIGKDEGTAQAIRAMGAEHVKCEVGDCVVDEKHKVVSTPAYMLAQRISEAADGIEKTVKKVLDLI